MSKQTLATKYRPKVFKDVTEQEEIVKILKNQIKNNEIRNCYLFTGPSGVGKTTLARIVARELNGGDYGVTEMDAASNNGVEDVRNLIDKSSFAALDTKYRVFILDEAHSYTSQSWQAFLKTLEEPPQGSIFMFCTTDPQKIPDTILNRVQRFDLHKISNVGICNRLKEIVRLENLEKSNMGMNSLINISDDAIEYISKLSKGQMRDAISMLDKCLSLKDNVDLSDVVSMLGSVDYEEMFNLFFSIYNYDERSTLSIIEDIYNSGKNLKLFVKNFVSFILDICKYKIFKDDRYISIPKTFNAELDRTLQADNKVCKDMLDAVNSILTKIKYESLVLPIVETDLLLLCRE